MWLRTTRSQGAEGDLSRMKRFSVTMTLIVEQRDDADNMDAIADELVEFVSQHQSSADVALMSVFELPPEPQADIIQFPSKRKK